MRKSERGHDSERRPHHHLPRGSQVRCRIVERCDNGWIFWPSEGKCFQLYTQGPCHKVRLSSTADNFSCLNFRSSFRNRPKNEMNPKPALIAGRSPHNESPDCGALLRVRSAPPAAILLSAPESLLRALHARPLRGGPRLLVQSHQPEHALHVRRGHGEYARR